MRIPLKQWCADQGITAIHQSVRENTNGYPYATFLRGNEAENIYFSIKGAEKVSAGTEFKGIAKELYIVPVENANGEKRLKLSFNGESTYVDIAELF